MRFPSFSLRVMQYVSRLLYTHKWHLAFNLSPQVTARFSRCYSIPRRAFIATCRSESPVSRVYIYIPATYSTIYVVYCFAPAPFNSVVVVDTHTEREEKNGKFTTGTYSRLSPQIKTSRVCFFFFFYSSAIR